MADNYIDQNAGDNAIQVGQVDGDVHIHQSAFQQIIQGIVRFLKQNIWHISLVIIFQACFGLLFFYYEHRFLLSRLIYLLLTLLLAIIIWSWVNIFFKRVNIQSKRVFFSVVGAGTFLWSILLGIQVYTILFPPKFLPSQFGIAIATFGECTDTHAIRHRGEISDLLISRFDEATNNTSELSNVSWKQIGVICTNDQGYTEAARIGAKLVIWGRILEKEGGVVIHFQVLETLSITDNPSTPSTLPLIPRSLEAILPIAEANSLTIEQQASSEGLIITAFSLGLYHYFQFNYKLAAQQFEIALKHLQNTPKTATATDPGLIYYYLGRSYQLLGNFEQSQKMLNQAAALSPDDPAILLGQAYNYRVMGQEEQRQQTLEQVVILSKQLPYDEIPAVYDRALAYEALGDQEAALREYQAIIQEFNPNFFIAYLSAGRVLMRLNRFAEAEDIYQQAQNLVQDDFTKQIWVYLDTGRLYELRGQTELAIRAYKQALTLNDKLVTPYFYLAGLYERLGINDAAFLNYKKVTELSDNRAWAYSLLADFLYRSKNYTAAIEQYHQALRYPIYNASLIHTGLGLAYASADETIVPNKKKYALDQFEQALQNSGPNEAYIHSRYGNVLAQFGEIDKAIAQMELSVKADQGIGIETKLNLGQLYQSTGECKKAKKLYEELIKLTDQTSTNYRAIIQGRLAVLEGKDGCQPFSP